MLILHKLKMSSLIISSTLILNMCAQNTVGDKTQLNAGIGISQFGVPVYLGLDYGIHPDISLGIEGSYRQHTNSIYQANLIGIGANINYHFNNLLKIRDNHWDVYAGGTLSYWFWNWNNTFPGSNQSGTGFAAQIGGRYFFNPKLALNLEIGGGTLNGSKLGITHRF
jgi:outer membrane immunogenic protein